MGEVYLAQDTQLDRKVALKLLPSHATEDEGRLRRFVREAKSASALNHPNILTIYEIGQVGSIHFIATEFIEGETLRRRLTETRITLREALDIGAQAAGALAAAHEKGIVHRDIKPENIMLRRDDFVKILDFGLAKLREKDTTGPDSRASTMRRSDTEPGTVLGTVSYMSPEQARGLEVDERSDIFSLGVVLYETVAGRPPFEGSTKSDVVAAILDQDPPPLARYVREVPETLEWIVTKALAKKREERYSSAKDLAQDLRRLRQQLEIRAEVERSVPRDGTSRLANLESIAVARTPTPVEEKPVPTAERVALLYKRHAQPDEYLLKLIETQLVSQKYQVFVDRHMTIGVEWAQEIERQVRSADAVIPLLSAASISSEMLAYEVQIAQEAAQQQNGKPRLLPVRVNYEGPLPESLAGILDPIHYTLWRNPQDDQRLTAELLNALRNPAAGPTPPPSKLEPVGGAVPLDSQFYIVRPTDEQFRSAIQRHDSIVLVKGARQMGKTSLLARGLQQARGSGGRVVLTDFQKLNAVQLTSVEALFMALGESIASQLDLDVFPDEVWNPRRGPSINFERYLRRDVLGKITSPLVWGLDEVDRLFTCDFGSEIFGLFRSWHNERALDPEGPWQRLTLAIAYATEAHLFITDMNQSPFNVGTRLALDDFSVDQLAELNRRYGSPLRETEEVARYFRLVGGHPYLVRRGLHEMATQGTGLSDLESEADRDEGPFGDHLRRILVSLAHDPALCDVVRGILRSQPCPNAESFYRLRSAGIMSGDSARDVKPRCQLYSIYLERHLL